MDSDGSPERLASLTSGSDFLGYLSTFFQLKDSANQSLGEVTHSGIYVQENGQTGVVQELNFSV